MSRLLFLLLLFLVFLIPTRHVSSLVLFSPSSAVRNFDLSFRGLDVMWTGLILWHVLEIWRWLSILVLLRLLILRPSACDVHRIRRTVRTVRCGILVVDMWLVPSYVHTKASSGIDRHVSRLARVITVIPVGHVILTGLDIAHALRIFVRACVSILSSSLIPRLVFSFLFAFHGSVSPALILAVLLLRRRLIPAAGPALILVPLAAPGRAAIVLTFAFGYSLALLGLRIIELLRSARFTATRRAGGSRG